MKKKNRLNKKDQKDNTNLKESRRDFLKTAWKGLGVVAGLEITGLTLHFLADRHDSTNVEIMFEVGFPDEFPLGTVTPFRKGHFYLVRMNDGGFIAITIKCSHLGCSVLWDEKNNEFICPCHSSKFSIDGNVINPPAPRALDIYEIKFEKGKIFVDLSKKIKRAEFEKAQLTYI